jgi:NDP-sugar pyrophosphorylase family protein
MQAVILAGGLGTRLGDRTKTMPKSMVPVAGKPYLEHQVAELRRQGITDIVLLVGHLGEQIDQHFGDGSMYGVRIRYGWERTPQGTGGGLREAADLLAETFLLIYGDSYLPIDYREVHATLADDPSAIGVAVVYDNSESTTVPNNIGLAADGTIVRYVKDAIQTPDLRYVEAGVLAFRKSVVELLPPGRPISLEKEVFPLLIDRSQLRGYITRERFYDIGTPDRLAVIDHLFSTPVLA